MKNLLKARLLVVLYCLSIKRRYLELWNFGFASVSLPFYIRTIAVPVQYKYIN